MGQALSVYLLPEAVVRQLPGGGDEALLGEVLKAQEEALRAFDEQAAEQFGDEGLPLTMAEAITGLFSGHLDPAYPFYGIAFEFVCASLGEGLDNRGFVPCSVDLYPKLDVVLAARAMPLRMTDLVGRPPIELPDWDDLLCGHWSGEEIRRGEPALAAALALDSADRESGLGDGVASGGVHPRRGKPDA
jgi:hypothetical protein